MARNRNKNRRRKKEHHPKQPQTPRDPGTPVQPPFWKRSHKALYGVLVFVTLVVTLLEGYPWLSIHNSGMTDPSNPYSEMFMLVNEGYVPVTNLDADCILNSTMADAQLDNIGGWFPKFADYLAHGGSVTVPCFKTFVHSGGPLNPSEGSTLKIVITYALYHLNIRDAA